MKPIPEFEINIQDYYGWEITAGMQDIVRRMVDHYNTHIVATFNKNLEE